LIISLKKADAQKDTVTHFNLDIKTGFSGIYYPTKNDLSQFNMAVPLIVSLNISDMISFNAGVVYHLKGYSLSKEITFHCYPWCEKIVEKVDFNYLTLPLTFSLALWQIQNNFIKSSLGTALGCTFKDNKINCSQDLMLGKNLYWILSVSNRHYLKKNIFIELEIAFQKYHNDIEPPSYYNTTNNIVTGISYFGNNSKESITISILFGFKL
jgi:hypothetical protein